MNELQSPGVRFSGLQLDFDLVRIVPKQPLRLRVHEVKEFRLPDQETPFLLAKLMFTCVWAWLRTIRANTVLAARRRFRVLNGELLVECGTHHETTYTNVRGNGPVW